MHSFDGGNENGESPGAIPYEVGVTDKRKCGHDFEMAEGTISTHTSVFTLDSSLRFTVWQ